MIVAVFSLRQSVSSVPWGFGRCGAAELRAPDVAVDANGGGAGGAGAGAGADADAVAAPGAAGFWRAARSPRAAWR